MSVLEGVNIPADLKDLSIAELEKLAEEIRQFIITNVSQTGGHLASSLGAVELSIAMHHVFNTPHDKIVWDVGHQAYAHKILTGRKDKFASLRQDAGIKPFVSPEESEYDAFVSGHAGNAVSAACGICEAIHSTGGRNRAIAVIGDGSLSNGLTFEGLNFVGSRKLNMIVVLNDNKMFISDQVGALADYLSRIMTSRPVRGLTANLKNTLKSMPRYGEQLYKAAKYIEGNLKGVWAEGMLFEEMGFRYVGPIDGHNIQHLVEAFRNISMINEPIFLHVITQKGRGFDPAMQDPENFHGVSSFHPHNGKSVKVKAESFSDVFGNTLVDLAGRDESIVAITAAMCSGTGLKPFKQAYPKRFFDVGIAEGHAVTMAGGMAANGLHPVVAIYSTFLQRSYDDISHDVALNNLPVVFAVDRAGLVGADGPTHHGTFDIEYLRAIPNMTVMVPRDQLMLEKMLTKAVKLDGPSAIRFPRSGLISNPIKAQTSRKGCAEVLKEGSKAVIFAVGPLCYAALEAAAELEGVAVVDLKYIKPLDSKTVTEMVETCGGRFIVVEDGCIQGGCGSAVLEVLDGISTPLRFSLLGIPDRFIEHGSQEQLFRSLGLDAQGIAKAVKKIL